MTHIGRELTARVELSNLAGRDVYRKRYGGVDERFMVGKDDELFALQQMLEAPQGQEDCKQLSTESAVAGLSGLKLEGIKL